VRARWSAIACQCGEGPAGDVIDRPLVHRFGADRAGEADRGPVPVQRPTTAVGNIRGARTRRQAPRAAPDQARSPGAWTGRRDLRGRCRAPLPTSRSSGITTRTRRLRSRPRRRDRTGPAPRRIMRYAAAPESDTESLVCSQGASSWTSATTVFTSDWATGRTTVLSVSAFFVRRQAPPRSRRRIGWWGALHPGGSRRVPL
jgi:hypothetical protein